MPMSPALRAPESLAPSPEGGREGGREGGSTGHAHDESCVLQGSH
jgi:hypothetical protein